MGCAIRLVPIVLGLAVVGSTAPGSDLGRPIDLSSFDRIKWPRDIEPDRHDEIPLELVDNGLEPVEKRVYVSGIVGASFATLATGGSNFLPPVNITQRGSVNDTLFTGGGAIGLALTRPSGLLRMEVEGRARGPMSGQPAIVLTDGLITKSFPLDVRVTDGWSATTNFWRDYFINDAFGLYAGGGFGVGGYQYAMTANVNAPVFANSDVTTFAWQAGAGFTYRLGDRVTIDTGYRFFAMTPDSTPFIVGAGFPALYAGNFTSTLNASELLLSLRIYEPFRGLR